MTTGSDVATMIDRLTDDISRATKRAIPVEDCRRMADGLVSDFLRREAGEDTVRLRAALSEIRGLTLESARFGSTEVPITRGRIVAILRKHGVS